MRDEPEAAGLLALMLLGHSRRAARFLGGELALLDRLDLDDYRYYHSTRADLLRRLGRNDEARAAYTRALQLAETEPERRFLQSRLNDLSQPSKPRTQEGSDDQPQSRNAGGVAGRP
jgi:predicted RNA polymerase sigma factor